MKSKLITILLILSLSISMCLSGCSKGEALDPEPTPTPSIEVTPMITPEVTPEPIPSEVVEPTPSAVLPDWEEPPVSTIYTTEADLNSDGHVDKSEWQSWVDQHPEDLDQDLIITDAEQKAYADSQKPPVQTQKPSTGGSTGDNSGGGTTGGNTTPPTAQTPPPPIVTDTSDEDAAFIGSGADLIKGMEEQGDTKTEEEKKAFDDAAQKGFDPLQ